MDKDQVTLTKGKALRFIGGFCLIYGLVGLLTPSSPVQRDMILMAVGSAISIFGLSANS